MQGNPNVVSDRIPQTAGLGFLVSSLALFSSHLACSHFGLLQLAKGRIVTNGQTIVSHSYLALIFFPNILGASVGLMYQRAVVFDGPVLRPDQLRLDRKGMTQRVNQGYKVPSTACTGTCTHPRVPNVGRSRCALHQRDVFHNTRGLLFFVAPSGCHIKRLLVNLIFPE